MRRPWGVAHAVKRLCDNFGRARFIFLAAQDENLASRMPSGCGFFAVAGNPWPDGTRLASNISIMAVRDLTRPNVPIATGVVSWKSLDAKPFLDEFGHQFVALRREMDAIDGGSR